MLSAYRPAKRMSAVKASAIREILKVAGQPGMISLAGGIPASETFPLDLMPGLMATALETYGEKALQYDLTEGFLPLRKALSKRLEQKGMKVDPEELTITSGSQGALDAAGKVMVNPGDAVAVESPTYLGALQAFNPYGPRYVSIETDEEGILPERLATAVVREGIRLVYLVPNFQNPTGRTLSLERRQAIADLAREQDFYVIEDDPYGDLRYSGSPVPPIWSFAPERVIYAGSLSKVFAPGLRIGFLIAPEPVRQWMIRVKQGVDLHTATLSQALAAVYIEQGHLVSHLPDIISVYKPRRDAMLEALEQYFPKSYTWSHPEGGMFLWIQGPEGVNMSDVYETAVRHQVAFVPGCYFFPEPDAKAHATLRLNFSMQPEEMIRTAIKRLSEIL